MTDVFDLDCDDEMRETIEKSARHLYGLVHARYIVTTRGLAKMVSTLYVYWLTRIMLTMITSSLRNTRRQTSENVPELCVNHIRFCPWAKATTQISKLSNFTALAAKISITLNPLGTLQSMARISVLHFIIFYSRFIQQ